ncbi:MAG: hypothetical protein P1U38_01040 [Aeromicrobium sp.]|mgnify:CR=1 FL=1|nr:hypothetical protein [Aeromicrobium sp.]MCK5890692.1 hypothetical protein [Aeromicrobium sp.]MDF1703339.1 hypothetical protein [Aeromicrobium sp.]
MILFVAATFLLTLLAAGEIARLVHRDGLGQRTPPRSHPADAFEPGHRER